MTPEEPKQTPEIPRESKYADNFEFWRIGTDFLPPVNTNTNYYNHPPDLVLKIANINQHLKNSKTNYIIFYDKEKMPPPPSIPVTIDGKSLIKVKAKRVLGIIIDEDLTFTTHIEHITQKCKVAYNRLTLYPDLSHQFAL